VKAVLIAILAVPLMAGRPPETWIVSHVLSRNGTIAIVKGDALLIGTKGQKLDTANIFECASIAGLKKVAFYVDKKLKIVKKVKE
jgi:hypothetical protein